MSRRYIITVAILLLGSAGSTVANAKDVETSAMSSESQIMELPGSAGSGPGKEVDVLLDASYLKLATIALRQGTVLPPHSAPVPATILVLEGEGVSKIGGKVVPVSKGTLISLAAGEEHDVVPKPDSDMLLLVHYLRGAQDQTSP
jgi:quercetin dioxygenase-like cupin family protein